MKKIIILLLVISHWSLVIGQSLSPRVITTNGGYFTGGGNTLSFTMGETFYTTLQNGNLMLTQGEQQPYITLRILNLRAFIEGFYIAGTGTMQPVLFNAGVSSDPTICDSITVELHDQFDPNILISTNFVALHTDGWAEVRLPTSLSGGSYYIAIKSRNAIETWSKVPVTLGNNTTFDFTH